MEHGGIIFIEHHQHEARVLQVQSPHHLQKAQGAGATHSLHGVGWPQRAHVRALSLREELMINQKECERSGKYVEAEGFKRKIKMLREESGKRDMIEMRQRHDKERK